MEIKVISNELVVDRWFCHKPSLTPNSDGNIVIISAASFGPLEVFEWGIDSGGKPYELYKWCENDFYENENYTKNITSAELLQKVSGMIRLTADNGLSDWSRLFEEARTFCEERIGARDGI